MLDLNDPRWAEMNGGYRVPFDARPLLKRFTAGNSREAAWKEVWDDLHHQGDVDLASYAALPHLVLASSHQRCWEIYAYAATIAFAAGHGANPSIPEWMQNDHKAAMLRVLDFAIEDIRNGVPQAKLRSILSFIAAFSGETRVSELILDMDLCPECGPALVREH